MLILCPAYGEINIIFKNESAPGHRDNYWD